MERAQSYSSPSNSPSSSLTSPSISDEFDCGHSSTESSTPASEEEKEALLLGCRIGRSGTLIKDIRSDSPVPFAAVMSESESEPVTNQSCGPSAIPLKMDTSMSTSTSTSMARIKKLGACNQENQQHPLYPLGREYNPRSNDDMVEELPARPHLTRSPYEFGLQLRLAPSEPAEPDNAIERTKDFQLKKAEPRRVIFDLGNVKVEEKD